MYVGIVCNYCLYLLSVIFVCNYYLYLLSIFFSLFFVFLYCLYYCLYVFMSVYIACVYCLYLLSELMPLCRLAPWSCIYWAESSAGYKGAKTMECCSWMNWNGTIWEDMEGSPQVSYCPNTYVLGFFRTLQGGFGKLGDWGIGEKYVLYIFH